MVSLTNIAYGQHMSHLNRLALTNAVHSSGLDGVRKTNETSAAEEAYAAAGISKTELSPDLEKKAAEYAKFFPVRDGERSGELAKGVFNPAYEGFSKGKDQAELIQAARQTLDKNYEDMAASGKPFNAASSHGRQDINTSFQDFDRRTLNAIANDRTGTFSEDEKSNAAMVMSQQYSLAIGIYSGPKQLESEFKDPFVDKPVERDMASLKFLDAVNEEEKTSLTWMKQRAMAQAILHTDETKYNISFNHIDTGNPVVNLFARAYAEMSNPLFATLAKSDGFIEVQDMPSWKRGMELWSSEYQPNNSFSFYL